MLIRKTPSLGNWSREMLGLSIPSGTVFLTPLWKKRLWSLTPSFHSCGIPSLSSSWQQPSRCLTPALAQHSSRRSSAWWCSIASDNSACPCVPWSTWAGVKASQDTAGSCLASSWDSHCGHLSLDLNDNEITLMPVCMHAVSNLRADLQSWPRPKSMCQRISAWGSNSELSIPVMFYCRNEENIAVMRKGPYGDRRNWHLPVGIGREVLES